MRGHQSTETKPTDLLRTDLLNSLPRPLMASMAGGSCWEIVYVCVETGLMKLNVCGMLDNEEFGGVMEIIDACNVHHDADKFYNEEATQ